MSSEIPKKVNVDSKEFINYSLGQIVKERILGTTQRGTSTSKNIPLIKMGDIGRGDINIISNEQIKYNSDLDSLLLRRGDILFNTRNTPALVGKSAIFLGNGVFTFDNNLMRLRLTKDVCPFFLNYQLNSKKIIQNLFSISSGTTSVAAIYWKDLKKIQITLPPLPEQKRIANILFSLDKMINLLNEKINKLDLLIKSISNKSIEDLLIEKEHCEDLSKLVSAPVTYGIVQPGKFDPNGIILVRGQDYLNGWGKTKFFKVSKKLNNKYERSLIHSRDLLMCIVGANTGDVTITPDLITTANITQTTARIRVDDSRLLPEFLLIFLRSIIGKKRIKKYIKGSAQPGLNLSDLEKIQVPVPNLHFQEKIVNVIQSLNLNKQKLTQKKEKYCFIRQSFSEELIFGHKRIKV